MGTNDSVNENLDTGPLIYIDGKAPALAYDPIHAR